MDQSLVRQSKLSIMTATKRLRIRKLQTTKKEMKQKYATSVPQPRPSGSGNRIFLRKLQEKTGNKNFGKRTSHFLKSQDKIDFWDLVAYNNMRAANKVSGNKITGIKVISHDTEVNLSIKRFCIFCQCAANYFRMHRKFSYRWSSLRSFHKKDFSFMHLYIEYSQGCF